MQTAVIRHGIAVTKNKTCSTEAHLGTSQQNNNTVLNCLLLETPADLKMNINKQKQNKLLTQSLIYSATYNIHKQVKLKQMTTINI